MSNNNNPIIPITGSNVISQIKTAAGTILNSISGSGYVYAPYVPLQVTNVNMSIATKLVTNFMLYSSITPDKMYQIALGQKYKFLSNYKQEESQTDLYDDQFKVNDMFFISNIIEVKDIFHAYPAVENTDVDYLIKIIPFNSENDHLTFRSKEFLKILDNQIMEMT